MLTTKSGKNSSFIRTFVHNYSVRDNKYKIVHHLEVQYLYNFVTTFQTIF